MRDLTTTPGATGSDGSNPSPDPAARLLAWYDRHARDLPWRVLPAARAEGVRTDPYRVWLSEVMLQQTTVAAVDRYFRRFTTLWPRVEDLAAEEDARVMAEWAGLGYYARARNLLACARVVTRDHGGRFPDGREALLALPGIGPYTAAAIAAIAFDRPETVVDGNVERVMARRFAVEEPLPGAKKLLTEHAARLTPDQRPGDYAQAVMDLGATICTPRNPACGICPWSDDCAARAKGIATELPRKMAKKPKPVRLGTAYVGRTPEGAWLLEDRPARGLLGGMLGWPGGEWLEVGPEAEGDTGDDGCPAPGTAWQQVGEVRHTFTHFHLRLVVRAARLPAGFNPPRGRLVPAAEFDPAALPTLFRKVHAASRDAWTD
ncbi:A/G-specific DNA-adenine glycosylase [Brevirhabdus pacifica]|nr:A/G-specific DNA-adenine glycosylase [Brevirhabdus pacifica]